jgi:hypothetical protein
VVDEEETLGRGSNTIDVFAFTRVLDNLARMKAATLHPSQGESP